jgi:hypothetical protein
VLSADEGHAEALANLYVRGYAGKYPLEEFTDPDRVRKAITERKYVWMVGISDKEVVGSTVGILADWNRSFEPGRAIVYPPQFRKRGIIQRLTFGVVEECFKRYDIGWFAMRDATGVRFAEKNGLGLLGFLPGLHKVEERETHLMYATIEDKFRRTRLAHKATLDRYGQAVINAEVELDLDTSFGEYPPEVIIGDDSGEHAETDGVITTYHFERLDNAVLIGEIKTDGDQINGLIKLLSNVPLLRNADYVHVGVLADKFEAHRRLREIGFEMCAFIPGWFFRNGRRYDCIRFVKHSESRSLDKEVASRVDMLREIYDSLWGSSEETLL